MLWKHGFDDKRKAMKRLIRISVLGILLLGVPALSGCAGLAVGNIFEVDEDVEFGEKLLGSNLNFGAILIFPYIGTSPGLRDFKFQCEGYSCVIQTTGFGMRSLEMVGITPVPLIPFWSPKQESKRYISMSCTFDRKYMDLPMITVHAPDEILYATIAEVKEEGKEIYISYLFEAEHVDFDKFYVELDETCNNIRIPFHRRLSYFYLPFFFFVND